ncbi:hypothetical protein IAT38_007364 [Cryptococcus sp. DSM 104549]
MDFDVIPYEDITWGQRLGSGSFGSVYKGTYLGVDIAIKEVLPSTEYDVHKYFEREWRIMRECRHPNIVLFLGLSKAPGDDGRVFIISEYVPRGNLRQYILSANPFPWRLRLSFATDVARAVAYLHARQCIHRDLKGENLLLTSNERIKVTDFGFARIASRNEEELRRMTYCGTDGYMSPEIINGGDLDLPTDVFSLGIIFIEIMCRRLVDSKTFIREPPSWTPDPEEVGRRASPGCPTPFISLALMCTLEDPASRPTMPAVLSALREIELEVLSRMDDPSEHVGSIRLVHRNGKRAMPIFEQPGPPVGEEEEEKRAEEEALRRLTETKVDVDGNGATRAPHQAEDGHEDEGDEKWRTARWHEAPSLMSYNTANSEIVAHQRLIPSTSSSLTPSTADSLSSADSAAAQPQLHPTSAFRPASPHADDTASVLTVRGVATSAGPPVGPVSSEPTPSPSPSATASQEVGQDDGGVNMKAVELGSVFASAATPGDVGVTQYTTPSAPSSPVPIPQAQRRVDNRATHRFTLVDKDSVPLINGKRVLASGFTSTLALALFPKPKTQASPSPETASGTSSPAAGGLAGKCAVCGKKVGQRPGLQCDDCHVIVHVKCSHAAPRNCTGVA